MEVPLSDRCYPLCPGRCTWLSSWLTLQRDRHRCNREASPSSAVGTKHFGQRLSACVWMHECDRQMALLMQYSHLVHALHTSRCLFPAQSISEWEEKSNSVMRIILFFTSEHTWITGLLHSLVTQQLNTSVKRKVCRHLPPSPLTRPFMMTMYRHKNCIQAHLVHFIFTGTRNTRIKHV